MAARDPWMGRILPILLTVQWVALVAGAFGSLPGAEQPGAAVAATISGALYVVASTIVPLGVLSRRFVLEAVTLGGVLLTMVATTLTGSVSSPFLLLSLTPAMVATVVRGLPIGLASSVLAAGLLTLVGASQYGWGGAQASLGTIALFPLLSLMVFQIRRIIVDAEGRADELAATSAVAQAKLVRLEAAHDLLGQLSEVYVGADVNPITVGTSVLSGLVDRYPGSAASATMLDGNGPVVITRVGSESLEQERHVFDLLVGGRAVGHVTLSTPTDLDEADRREVERLLTPVSLSFSNAMMLKAITDTAVQEERLRLARELHDEVGPTLASLGLGLDVAAMLATPDDDLASHLAEMRTNVTRTIEDVRRTVADLRAEPAESLTAEIRSLTAGLPDRPSLQIDLAESRHLPPAIARQISAIVVEAIRNSHRHAEASSISVSGTIDPDKGELEVRDDGRGFDPAEVPDGHFGLMGMRERAERISADLSIDSRQDGTAVRLSWKGRK